MANTGCVWGIDIGQCALKALRCRPHDDDDNKLTAEAFDYIEYPKILSQPEADPVELVREALQTFLKRNSVRGDKVAISVSGQSGLARFIKLPPVESKKIPDIVKYEARQQIPFPLDDVIWDYQQMAGGSIEEGFALETEVGLFAMKRDQVYRALKPLDDAGIEIDVIQLMPLAIYNFTAFDQMPDLPPVEEYDPENPPASVVVLSLGTETTDMVVTNGFRVWQRSLPLGGSHFTKALTKELRLTFAKAEHLKRNATQAEDPKAVFQAMRPVFNELLTEVQRSIAYFTGIDRTAKIGRVVALGNAMKLPGLQKYLSQNLGYPVAEVEAYRQLSGSSVVGAGTFRENLLSFAVCYGLAIQALHKGKIHTNLLPREIVTNRLIREKKPWAVGTLAAVMLGCVVSYLAYWRAWNSVDLGPQYFGPAFAQAEGVQTAAKGYVANYDAAKTKYAEIDKIGASLVGNIDGRLMWPELLKAISESMPHDPPDKHPADIGDRNEIHIEELDMERLPDLSVWYAGVKDKIDEAKKGIFLPSETPVAAVVAGAAPPDANAAPAAPAGAAAPPAVPGAAPGDATAPAGEGAAPTTEGPTGEGWVIQIKGFHFHNKRLDYGGAKFVRDTFMKNLEEKKIMLPDGEGGKPKLVSIKELGLGYPVIVRSWRIRPVEIRDPNEELAAAAQLGPGGRPGAAAPPQQFNSIKLMQFDFILQMCWQETPLSKRLGGGLPKTDQPTTEGGAAPTAPGGN
jgi:type IV pilus assembly protein PilM